MSIAIIRASVDDWTRVRDVRLRALADSPDAFWTTLEQARERTETEWCANLEPPSQATFLGVLDDQDAGMVMGAPHHGRNGDAGLYGMWVAPEARGTGLARQLVEAVIAWAREAGHPVIRLDVNDDNVAAQRLYARCGFTATGHRDSFPPPRDHLHEHELAVELSSSSGRGPDATG